MAQILSWFCKFWKYRIHDFVFKNHNLQGEYVVEELENCKISARRVCVKWWKLGRWFHGFRMRDESHSRWVSLADLAKAKEQEVLIVLQRGAIHEVLCVQISAADPTCTPWSC